MRMNSLCLTGKAELLDLTLYGFLTPPPSGSGEERAGKEDRGNELTERKCAFCKWEKFL